MDPKPNDWYPYKKSRKDTDTRQEPRGDRAETGAMSQGMPGLPAANRSQERALQQSLPRASPGEHPAFGEQVDPSKCRLAGPHAVGGNVIVHTHRGQARGHWVKAPMSVQEGSTQRVSHRIITAPLP